MTINHIIRKAVLGHNVGNDGADQIFAVLSAPLAFHVYSLYIQFQNCKSYSFMSLIVGQLSLATSQKDFFMTWVWLILLVTAQMSR